MRHGYHTRGGARWIATALVVAMSGFGMPKALGQDGRPGSGHGRRLRADREGRLRRSHPGGPQARRGRAFHDGEGVATDLDSVLKFLETHFPQQHRNLSMLRSTDQPLFERRMRQMMPRLHRMMTAFERNPEAGKLMIDDQRLSFRIHNFAEIRFNTDDPARRAEIRAEVRDLVAQRMDVEQKIREIEIRRLERRLESIKKRLARDLDRRDELIERQLDDLDLLED